MSLIGEMSPAEVEAWKQLQRAAAQLEAARAEVMAVTNRESRKRRARPHLRLVTCVSGTPDPVIDGDVETVDRSQRTRG
jgi:hypothetical protein